MGKINKSRMMKSLKKKRLLLNIWLLLIVVLLCYSSYEWYFKKEKQKEVYKVDNLVSDLQGHTFETKLKELKKINSDVLGIIEILNTDFEQVFVQSKDNNEYLTQDIYKEKNKAGVPFLDYKVNLDSKKILIYGHNSVYYDAPFHYLENYYDEDFYNQHRYILMKLENETRKYEIFSVYVEPSDWDYMKIDFRSEEEYLEHIEKLRKKSMYESDIKIKDEQILILQTCSFKKEYQGYQKKFLLIIARRVN